MLNYNVLNEYVERLKSGNVTTDDLIKVSEVVKDADLQAKYVAENIKAISNDILNEVKCGDVIAKKTGEQYHNYIVTFKQENVGICLTYIDATVVETQSYDYVTNTWVYNSEDKTNLINYTAGSNVSINNGVISATDTTYTAGENITIEEGVISASGGGALYQHLVEISESDTNNKYKIIINLINDDNTPITASNIHSKILEKGGRVLASGFGMMIGAQGSAPYTNQWGNIYEVQAHDTTLTTHLNMYMDVIHDNGTILTTPRRVEGYKAIADLTITEVVNVEL